MRRNFGASHWAARAKWISGFAGIGACGGQLAVFGGYAGKYSGFLHLFDASKQTWTLATPAGSAPKPRQGASLTRYASGYVLFGGANDLQPFNDLHLLSSGGEAWTAAIDERQVGAAT